MSENSDSSRCINFADSFCATKSCCRLNCLTSINQEECARVKLSMCAMSLKEQKSWMLTTFSTAYCSDSHKFHHMLCGKSICSRAFTTITGISKSRYYEVRSSFLQGQFQVMKTSPSTRFHVGPELAMQWLKLYATDHGDKLPNHERVLLPCSMTKQAVYEQYCEEYLTSP